MSDGLWPRPGLSRDNARDAIQFPLQALQDRPLRNDGAEADRAPADRRADQADDAVRTEFKLRRSGQFVREAARNQPRTEALLFRRPYGRAVLLAPGQMKAGR